MKQADDGRRNRAARLRVAVAIVFALAATGAIATAVVAEGEERYEDRHRGNKAEEARREAERHAVGERDVPDHQDDGPVGGKQGAGVADQIKDLGNATRSKGTRGGKGPVVAEKPKAPAGGAQVKVASDDEFIDALLQAAASSGYGRGQVYDPHDAQTQLEWDKAVQHEHDVQKHLEHEFLALQKNVATSMNAYLAATAAWQEKFALISSATTGLQGLTQEWMEAKATLEKADFAFAMANLGVGGVKVGYKAYKWINKRKTAAVIAESIAAAKQGAVAETAAAGTATVESAASGGAALEGAASGGAALEGAAGSAKAVEGAAAVSEAAGGAQKIGSKAGVVVVAPADMHKPLFNVLETEKGYKLFVGVSSSSGTAQVQWGTQMAKLEHARKFAKAKGDLALAQKLEQELQLLAKARPTGAAQASATAMSDTAKLAALQAEWETNVAKLQNDIAKATKAGAPASFIDDAKQTLDGLLKSGKPTSLPKPPLSDFENATNAISPKVLKAAQEAGVDTKGTITQLAKDIGPESVEQAEWSILRAVAEAKGWHDMPTWAHSAIVNVLIEARQALAGVEGVTLSAAKLNTVKTIKGMVEKQGKNFSKWLATFGGEAEVVGEITYINKYGITQKETIRATEAIALGFDPADIKLLNNILETEGDLAKLRKVASPIEQLSLNALAQADAATQVPGLGAKIAEATAGTALKANRLGAVSTAMKPTDQQLENILHGTGAVGEIGLTNLIGEFGVIERTKDKHKVKAALGELWEFVSSPSATAGSYYFTWVALDELEALMKNHMGDVTQLGTHLDEAASALGNLQNALQRAGVANPDSYLNKGGPEELRRILEDMEKAYGSGSEGWKKDHKSQYDERVAHIRQKLADLADALKDLAALAERMKNLRQWLDSVRLNYDHTIKTPLEAFHPQVFVRLASISLYLRGMAGAAFGLTQDKPFHVVPEKPMNAKTAQVEKASFDGSAPKQEAPKHQQMGEVESEKAFEDFLKQSEAYDQQMKAGSGK